jgi:hypothetical protein
MVCHGCLKGKGRSGANRSLSFRVDGGRSELRVYVLGLPGLVPDLVFKLLSWVPLPEGDIGANLLLACLNSDDPDTFILPIFRRALQETNQLGNVLSALQVAAFHGQSEVVTLFVPYVTDEAEWHTG